MYVCVLFSRPTLPILNARTREDDSIAQLNRTGGRHWLPYPENGGNDIIK